MYAELTRPEELERHLRGATRIAHVTSLGSPVALLIEVETCSVKDSLFTQYLSNLRYDIRSLLFMLIGNATAAFVELVVP